MITHQHLPSDSMLLSNCFLRFCAFELMTTSMFRFCAGRDAQRFNLVPLLLDIVDVLTVDERMRRPLVPCISLCDTER